jgi:L-amino acid N-acyltransferase YncA
MSPPVVRPAAADDLDSIAAIYAHHVLTGVATFELDPPDGREWRRRFETVTGGGLPFLVAERDGSVVGYAYCAQWKSRPAYRHTVESSVYLAPDAVGRGIGGALLDGLLGACAGIGVRQVIAVVVDADADASLALHRSRGFVDAGRLAAVGYKRDRWLDTVLLQRALT